MRTVYICVCVVFLTHYVCGSCNSSLLHIHIHVHGCTTTLGMRVLVTQCARAFDLSLKDPGSNPS